jgi:hypothetical protein
MNNILAQLGIDSKSYSKYAAFNIGEVAELVYAPAEAGDLRL